MQRSHFADQGFRANLSRLAWIRLILIVGEGAAFAVASALDVVNAPLAAFGALLVLQALVSLWSVKRIAGAHRITAIELFAHLVFDVLCLTALLYLTGGSDNPFSMLYLLPLMLAAATLPGPYVWAMLLIALLCYSSLFFLRVPLAAPEPAHGESFRLHVAGMWVGFLLAAVLIASFATRMSAALRRQDQELALMRENTLKQEQLLALGTLAASTAHELGTPLTTLAVTLHDIEPGAPVDGGTLHLLRNQVARCKTILSTMSSAAGQPRAEAGSTISAAEYVTTLVSDWQLTRPGVRHFLRVQDSNAAPCIVPDKTLTHAITNVLNNAADASLHHVETRVQWNEQTLLIEISDQGAGISQDMPAKPGQPGMTTKDHGLGLGLFLSYATLERLGAMVTLFNREDAPGATCRIALPLAVLTLK